MSKNEKLKDKLANIKNKYSYLDFDKMSVEQIENSEDVTRFLNEIICVFVEHFIEFAESYNLGGNNNEK